MSVTPVEPHEEERRMMLESLDNAREMIESGRYRALFVMVIPRDADQESHQWDIGKGSFAEMIGWLEQLKMRLLIRAFDIMQDD